MTEPMKSPAAEPGASARGGRGQLLILVFMAGFLSLALEVVYIRMLSLVLGSTTYAVSVILASFLFGLALGNLTAARRAARDAGYGLTGLLVFTALANIIAYYLAQLVPLLFFALHRLPGPDVFLFFLVQLLPCFLVVLAPSWGMGAIYAACFVQLDAEHRPAVEAYGTLFFISTLGSIGGSLAAGFTLIPMLGIKRSLFLASAGYILLALTMVRGGSAGLFKRVGAGLLLLLALQLGLEPERAGEQFNFHMMNRCHSFAQLKANRGNTRTLFHAEDREGTVLVLEDLRGHTRYLSVAGKVEGSSSMDMPNQALLALLPATFTAGRQRALNIGLGTGSTLHHLAAVQPAFAAIDSVEVNRAVIEAMNRYFYPSLGQDGRVRHVVDDARRFLACRDVQYDLITSEPSYPTDSGVSFLFTDEFFRLVKSRLAVGGAFCQWLPAYLLDPVTRKIFEDTLCRSFPAVFRYRVLCSNDDLYIALPEDRELDGASIGQKMVIPEGIPRHPPLAEQLEFGGRLQSSGGTVFNTDDLPWLEFATVRNILERLRRAPGVEGG